MEKFTKDELVAISMKVIAHSGTAKSSIMESFKKILIENDIEVAKKLIDEADKELTDASNAHMEFLQAEGQGKEIEFSFLAVHAEDQMMAAQSLRDLVKIFIEKAEKEEK